MIVAKFKSFISANDDRSAKYKKNIFFLILSQTLAILVSLILVPLTLNYLGVKEYGVWLTLTTLITWFGFFDIGLGHGLRNKYAEAKAHNNESEMKKYVSTAFFILLILSTAIFIIFNIASFFINWSIVLNAPQNLSEDLKTIALFSAAMFCVRFVVSITNYLLIADQEPAIPTVINLFGNLLSLVSIYIITKTTKSSLLYVGVALTISQLFPLFCAFFYFFKTRYKLLIPNIKYFSKSHVKSIFSLGIRFFLIQLTALVLFQSNNVIIAHICGLENVTSFNIAYKYINVLYIAFSTFLTPLWSASTDAYTKGDLIWIKSCMKKIDKIWGFFIIAQIVFILISPLIYKFWLKNSLSPDFLLLTLTVMYFTFLARNAMYRSFMNGVGKITLQFYVTVIQSILHIPIAIFLGSLYGVNGIVFTMFLWVFINSIWEKIQFNYILNNKARGIWDK